VRVCTHSRGWAGLRVGGEVTVAHGRNPVMMVMMVMVMMVMVMMMMVVMMKMKIMMIIMMI
jgi:hypothetical protein